MFFEADDYGILVTVKVIKNGFLFVDDIDRRRYMSTFLKMFDRILPTDAVPIVAGLNRETAYVLFKYGFEEEIRSIFKAVHTSYASYRKIKKCPVKFSRTAYELVEGRWPLINIMKAIRDESDYVCMVFNEEDGEGVIEPGSLAQRIDLFPYKISEAKLFDLACEFRKVTSLEEFARRATLEQKSNFTHELRNQFNLSYRDIGKILKCSGATICRIMNKPN